MTYWRSHFAFALTIHLWKSCCCWTKHPKNLAKTRIIIIRIGIVTRPVLLQSSGTTHHQHITKVSFLLFSVTSFFLETGFRVILTNLFHILAFGQYWTETPACWQMTVDWTPCLKAWSGGGRTWRQALFLFIIKYPESQKKLGNKLMGQNSKLW